MFLGVSLNRYAPTRARCYTNARSFTTIVVYNKSLTCYNYVTIKTTKETRRRRLRLTFERTKNT